MTISLIIIGLLVVALAWQIKPARVMMKFRFLGVATFEFDVDARPGSQSSAGIEPGEKPTLGAGDDPSPNYGPEP